LTERGYTNTFRVISNDEYPPSLLAEALRRWYRLDRAAIVQLKNFWGNWGTESFYETFTSTGGFVTSLREVASTAEFTATLAVIKDEYPDLIYYADDNSNQAGLLSKVVQDLGMGDVVIALAPFTPDKDWLASYVGAAGAAVQHDLVAMAYRYRDDMPGYDYFNSLYQAANFPNFGEQAGEYGACSFDAIGIIATAIERASSADPAEIRYALATTTNYPGVVGLYQGFDDHLRNSLFIKLE